MRFIVIVENCFDFKSLFIAVFLNIFLRQRRRVYAITSVDVDDALVVPIPHVLNKFRF